LPKRNENPNWVCGYKKDPKKGNVLTCESKTSEWAHILPISAVFIVNKKASTCKLYKRNNNNEHIFVALLIMILKKIYLLSSLAQYGN
jgi:hypothetical protein